MNTDVPEKRNVSGVSEHHLLWMADKLHKIHTEFFASVDRGASDVDVRVCLKHTQLHHPRIYAGPCASLVGVSEQDVISDLRDHVLAGKVIAFSRVFPISENSQQQFLWQSALACGARCQDKVTPEVTHLVTTSGDTDKCREAMKQPSTFIVNVDWLVEAVMKWHLVDERNYQIPGCERRIPSFLLAAEKRPRPQDDTPEDSRKERRTTREGTTHNR